MGDHKQKSFFYNFSHKVNFFMGVGATLAVVFTIGFLILLSISFGDGEGFKNFAKDKSSDSLPSPQIVEPGSLPPTPSGEISLVPASNNDWIKGDKNAKVSIIEFSDTECPFCKRFHPTMQKIVAEYDGQVNWVYRHFPLSSLHKKAQKEAEATECAGELGGNDGFWAYLDRLFEITPSNDGLAESQLPQIAVDVGLNKSRFEDCLSSGKYAKKVKDQYSQAVAAGGQGTPYSVIVTSSGEKVPFSGALPYEQIKAILDSVL